MADEINMRDVIAFVTAGWDATITEADNQAGLAGAGSEALASWALIEVWMMNNLEEPGAWQGRPGNLKLMFVLELCRRGAEATEAAFDAELDGFIDGLLGGTDADGE